MEKNTKDALGQEIVIGNKYGYSTDNNGITQSVVGIAKKITATGKVTLEVVKGIRAYSDGIPKETHFEKAVSVKPVKLFPLNQCKCKIEDGHIVNQDIIDFRYDLIDKMYGEHSNLDSYEKAVYERVLIDFNIHFGTRNYDIG